MSFINVWSSDGIPLTPCSPARARILVAAGDAVWRNDAIRLTRSEGTLSNSVVRRDSSNAIINFTDYFSHEKDVYILNISEMQISLEFKGMNGEVQSHLLHRSPDPINLTQFVPFQQIAGSMSFRKMVNRQPAVIKLLTEEEYNGHYAARAAQAGVQAQQLEAQAMSIAQKVQNRVIDPSVEMPKFGKNAGNDESTSAVSAQDLVIKDTDLIHPRVMHLMQQVSSELPDGQKMPAADLLRELQTLQLKPDDLEYILSRAFWKSVKTWTRQQQALIGHQEEGDG